MSAPRRNTVSRANFPPVARSLLSKAVRDRNNAAASTKGFASPDPRHLLRHLEFQGPPFPWLIAVATIDWSRDRSESDDLSSQSNGCSVNRCNDTANPTRILARPRIIRSISRKRKEEACRVPGNRREGEKSGSLFTVHAQIAGISLGRLERGRS